MRRMAAGEFKAKCLRVMEEVRKYRTPVVITKKGKPVAKLVPADEPRKSIFGCMEGKIQAIGDIESPILPPIEEWDMMKYPWAARFGRERKKAAKRRSTKSRG